MKNQFQPKHFMWFGATAVAAALAVFAFDTYKYHNTYHVLALASNEDQTSIPANWGSINKQITDNNGDINIEVDVDGKLFKNYKATIDQDPKGTKAVAHVDTKSTEAGCADCMLHKDITLSEDFSKDKMKDLESDLASVLVAEINKSLPTTKAKKERQENFGHLKKADIAAYAAECETDEHQNDDDEQKMTCLKDQLVKLSDALEDDDAQASIVKKYFDTYMKKKLVAMYKVNAKAVRKAMSDKDTDPSDMDDDLLNAGNATAKSIIDALYSGLRETNGAKVVDELLAMEVTRVNQMGAVAKQSLYDSFQAKDPNKEAKAIQLYYQAFPEAIADRAESLDDSASDKFSDQLEKDFTNKVNSLEKAIINQPIGTAQNSPTLPNGVTGLDGTSNIQNIAQQRSLGNATGLGNRGSSVNQISPIGLNGGLNTGFNQGLGATSSCATMTPVQQISSGANCTLPTNNSLFNNNTTQLATFNPGFGINGAQQNLGANSLYSPVPTSLGINNNNAIMLNATRR